MVRSNFNLVYLERRKDNCGIHAKWLLCERTANLLFVIAVMNVLACKYSPKMAISSKRLLFGEWHKYFCEIKKKLLKIFLCFIFIRYIDIVAGLAVTNQGHIVAVDSVSPTVFIISEDGELVRWFDCSDYMREPSDIAISGE